MKDGGSRIEDGRLRIEDRRMMIVPITIFHPRSSILYLLSSPLYFA
jgi:hypothetical protein